MLRWRQLCECLPSVSTPNQAASASAPARAGLVLASLILVAAVANLNLAVANVRLPRWVLCAARSCIAAATCT